MMRPKVPVSVNGTGGVPWVLLRSFSALLPDRARGRPVLLPLHRLGCDRVVAVGNPVHQRLSRRALNKTTPAPPLPPAWSFTLFFCLVMRSCLPRTGSGLVRSVCVGCCLCVLCVWPGVLLSLKPYYFLPRKGIAKRTLKRLFRGLLVYWPR